MLGKLLYHLRIKEQSYFLSWLLTISQLLFKLLEGC